MKILSLVFKLNDREKNPSIFERLAIIEDCLSKNKDTNILVCSEAFLARIDNDSNKFTAIDQLNYNLHEMRENPKEYNNIDYIKLCEQSKIIKINDCESVKLLMQCLFSISLKYQDTLIIPGSVFTRPSNIENTLYGIKNGIKLFEYEKFNTFVGFEKIFKLSEVDTFKQFYESTGAIDPKYIEFQELKLRVANIKKYTKYLKEPNYEVAISICADNCPIKEEKNKEKLSIYFVPSYGLSMPDTKKNIEIITENIDIYIQPEGLNFETYVIKNPEFKGSFSCIENKLSKFENSIKCFTININSNTDADKHFAKYLKYKAKYIKLKTKNI